MVKTLKKLLYFPFASYFRFWAKIRLDNWKPKIVAITGSSGKTTLLHLIESQIGKKAKYSHHANSSYGIPFDILGLKRKTLTPDEWIYLFFLAPFKAFKPKPLEEIYVAEVDSDRPGEGKFLAELLNPEITLWISSSLTHSANFDSLVKEKNFTREEEAIAYDFGHFLEHTKKLAIVNGDNVFIQKELSRAKCPIEFTSEKDLKSWEVYKNRTEFIIDDKKYSINFITPKATFNPIKMTNLLMKSLKLPLDANFKNLILPPGRNSVFMGIKKTTIIDSTYNATPEGVRTILQMFDEYPSKNKWLVLGDMIELGTREREEHEKLATAINCIALEKIILIGPRVARYTYPKLSCQIDKIQKFLMPKEGLDYILENIKGEETILFKGARFLEGIIEHLLQNKKDIDKLVRREKAWQKKRKSFGL